MSRFKALRNGDVRVRLAEAEVELLRNLPSELVQLYESGDDDPVRARLFPRAYLDPTEESAEAEWQQLVHPELMRERLESLQLVTRSLDTATPGRGGELVIVLAADAVHAWLAVINDARLALGTRLGITEHTDLEELDPADPNAPGLAAYGWLTALEADLIDSLMRGMPD